MPATRDAAKEIGRWLEVHGRRDRPTASPGCVVHDAMVSVAITSSAVWAFSRIPEVPSGHQELEDLLIR